MSQFLGILDVSSLGSYGLLMLSEVSPSVPTRRSTAPKRLGGLHAATVPSLRASCAHRGPGTGRPIAGCVSPSQRRFFSHFSRWKSSGYVRGQTWL